MHRNESAKVAFLTIDFAIKALTAQQYNPWNQLKEEVYTRQVGIGFQQGNFFSFVVDEIIRKLLPTGVMYHSYKFHFDYMYRTADPSVSKPKVLTLDDLSVGFILWLSACGISSSCFILELIVWKIARVRKQKLKENIKIFKIHPTLCEVDDQKSQPNKEAMNAFKLKKPSKVKFVKVHPRIGESFQALHKHENYQMTMATLKAFRVA